MFWRRPQIEGSLFDQATGDQQAIVEAMRAVVLDDGSQLRVLDVGRGTPILLLPMVTELNFVYAPQLEEFQADHRVILYEPRLSARRRVGIADRANEVLALMSCLGIDRAHIVVWGDTGSAAYELAKRHPDKCLSLVFIGLADRYRFPQPYQLLLQLLQRLPIESLVPAATFATLLGRVVGGTQVKPEWIALRTAQVPEITSLFKHSILPNLVEHRPRAGEVSVRSLVICGDHDLIVSAVQARRMAALLPNAPPAIVVPGGEHFVSYVDGPLVNRLIRAFYVSLACGELETQS